MGTTCIPAYTNNLVAEFKQKYIYPLIKKNQFFSYAILMISLWYGLNLKYM